MSQHIEALRAHLGGRAIGMTSPKNNRWFIEVAANGDHLAAVEFLTKEFKSRLITISAVDEPAFVEILYHMDVPSGVITVRTKIYKPDDTIKSVAPANPAATLIEHEIMELFKINFEGNPRDTNMLIPDSRKDREGGMKRKASAEEARIDRNILSIVKYGSTTAPSKRVMKTRTALGLPENPPLCQILNQDECTIDVIAEEGDVVKRHPGMKKKNGGGE